jgi:hypothetical protein
VVVPVEVRRQELEAALAARGGMWRFVGLWRGLARVPAKMVFGGYGPHWRLRDSIVDECKVRWDVPAGGKSKVQQRMGLHEALEIVRGKVKTMRQQDGSVKVWVARAGCAWGTDTVLDAAEPGGEIGR